MATAYEPDLRGKILAISFYTRAEFLRYPNERRWGPARTARLKEALGNYLLIESSPPIAERWAELRNLGRQKGLPSDDGDCWIAATALVYRIPLISHNRKHFEWMRRFGLNLISHAPSV